MTTLTELRAKPHTSVSQLKTYLMCPRRYYFQYVLRMRPAFTALALVFGTAWHETIGQHLLRSRREHHVPVDDLKEHLRDGLIRGIGATGAPVLFEEEEQDVGAVVDLATRMLQVFLDRVPLPDVVHGVEVPFGLELAHPVTGEMLRVPLVGAMDAIVEVDGVTSIWELKTGKKKWAADQLDFDIQPTAYAIAGRALGYKNTGATLLVATKGRKPDVQIEQLLRHHRDERELAEVAFSVHRAVDAGIDHPLRGWQCRTCPFADACGA